MIFFTYRMEEVCGPSGNSFSFSSSRIRSLARCRHACCPSRGCTDDSSALSSSSSDADIPSSTFSLRVTHLSRFFLLSLPSSASLLLLILLSCLPGPLYAAASALSKVKKPVTYGSSIVLVHAATGYKIYSGKISWGSGSGQQAVTAIPPDERTGISSVFWNVEPPQNDSKPRPVLSPVLQQQQFMYDGSTHRHRKSAAAGEPVPALPTEGAAGEPVPCGATVVFEHAMSSVTIQALGVSSPISHNREVSAASGSQASLAGFKVICNDRSAKRWMIGDQVTLQHFAMGANLQAEKQHKFTPYNCGRGCPIEGHIEVSVSNSPRSASHWAWATPNDAWIAEPGILVGPDRFAFMGDEHADPREEL